MKRIVPMLILMIVFLPAVSALENNQYFTIDPNETAHCIPIEVKLPQELGISFVNETKEAVIEAESPWLKISYNKVTINPGVLNKNPLCFYPPSMEEGKYTYFKVKVYSSDLNLSSEAKGGFCVSRHEDVDSGIDAGADTDICRAMSDNSDIFDIHFKDDITFAAPGDRVSKTVYVTSYADVDINLRLVTSMETDFSPVTVSTSQDHPTSMKKIRVLAPSSEDNYTMRIIGEMEGCNSEFCAKEAESVLKVKENYTPTGFSASVVPRNINLKNEQPTDFRVIVNNYDSRKEFRISASSDPQTEIEPENATRMIGEGEEETFRFTVDIDSGDQKLYKLYFKIRTEDGEKLLTAYLSVGELMSDAQRDIEDIRTSAKDKETRDDIEEAFRNWKNSYESSEYGEETGDYGDFKKEIENARGEDTGDNGDSGGDIGGGEETPPQDTGSGGFDWILLVVPVIIVVAVVFIFVMYRKSKVVESEQEYPDFQ